MHVWWSSSCFLVLVNLCQPLKERNVSGYSSLKYFPVRRLISVLTWSPRRSCMLHSVSGRHGLLLPPLSLPATSPAAQQHQLVAALHGVSPTGCTGFSGLLNLTPSRICDCLWYMLTWAHKHWQNIINVPSREDCIYWVGNSYREENEGYASSEDTKNVLSETEVWWGIEKG